MLCDSAPNLDKMTGPAASGQMKNWLCQGQSGKNLQRKPDGDNAAPLDSGEPGNLRTQKLV